MAAAVVFMVSLPELLRRLRRAWAPPGAALSRIAPPTDVAARLRAELKPLLDAVTVLQASERSSLEGANAEAGRIVEAARGEAERMVRDAENVAPTTRSEAVRRRHRALDSEIQATLEDAEREAARIEEVSRERLPALVEEVKSCVLSYPRIGS
jgi:vacuolar-type H+-ATPase subunit H